MKRICLVIIIISGTLILLVAGFWLWQKDRSDRQMSVRNADTGSLSNKQGIFHDLGGDYGYYGTRDRQYIKYREEILEKADIFDFKYLGNGYAKDDNTVFYEGAELKEADAESFEKIAPWTDVFADRNFLYFYGDVLSLEEKEGVLTFLNNGVGGEELGNNYRKYKNRIFFWDDGGGQAVPGMVLIDADSETFVSVDNEYCDWDNGTFEYDPCIRYGKNDKKVFSSWFELEGADPSTFQILKGLFSKDNNSVFYDTKKLEGIDSKTFQVLGLGLYGKDENSAVYTNRNIIGADPGTFEVLHEKYCRGYRNALAKDKNSYYSLGARITEEQFYEHLASEKDEIKSIISTCN